MKVKVNIFGFLLIALLMIFEAIPIAAQDADIIAPSSPQQNLLPENNLPEVNPQWGTTYNKISINGLTCTPLTSTVTTSWSTIGGFTRYCTAGTPCAFICPVTFP